MMQGGWQWHLCEEGWQWHMCEYVKETRRLAGAYV